MFPRAIEPELMNSARQYPVVTLMGPRQSGKTTVVRHLFSHKPYVNLEAIETRRLAEEDPRGFLAQFPDGAILDEIQRVPLLLSYIQVIIDECQINGMFILTGSHQLALHEAITQSLAGRTALLNLYPMSLDELISAGFQLDTNAEILNGGFPRIYTEKLEPTKAYRNYFQTYVERDVRQLVNIKNLNLFEKFIKLCAGRIGNILEIVSLSNEVGVSSHTINEWLSLLEASFIIFRVQPYYENFGKRAIKSPKLYFTDVGLACYLLSIENTTQLSRDPLRGALFENLVILELMKYRLNRGLDPNLYFYRDSHQNEVDIIIKSGHLLIPVEIKSAQTFTESFLKNVRYFQKITDDRSPQGFVLYAGQSEQNIQQQHLFNYHHANKIWGYL